MRPSWGNMLLALVVVMGVAACAATVPPGPTATPGPTTAASPPGETARATDPAATDVAAPTPGVSPTGAPSGGLPTLPPGGRLAIRYSGTEGTAFNGLATALFSDGAVVPVDASGVLRARPHTQTLGEAIRAVRVTGTIISGSGTYRVEILGGQVREGVFVEEVVLATDEASGRDGEVRVDYGNIDL